MPPDGPLQPMSGDEERRGIVSAVNAVPGWQKVVKSVIEIVIGAIGGPLARLRSWLAIPTAKRAAAPDGTRARSRVPFVRGRSSKRGAGGRQNVSQLERWVRRWHHGEPC